MATIKYYFDEHMPRAVARTLMDQGIEVILAIDVEMTGADDDTEHLAYATEKDAVLVTRDFPFAGRAAKREDHSGLVCWTGLQQDIGGMIRVLMDFVQTHNAEDVTGRVFWLK